MTFLERSSIAILFAALVACGDGSFILVVNTGTIDDDPFCEGAGGRFGLRDELGLLVIVVIDGGTTIVLANGVSGTCADLSAGNEVDVRGAAEGDTIMANEIFVR